MQQDQADPAALHPSAGVHPGTDLSAMEFPSWLKMRFVGFIGRPLDSAPLSTINSFTACALPNTIVSFGPNQSAATGPYRLLTSARAACGAAPSCRRLPTSSRGRGPGGSRAVLHRMARYAQTAATQAHVAAHNGSSRAEGGAAAMQYAVGRGREHRCTLHRGPPYSGTVNPQRTDRNPPAFRYIPYISGGEHAQTSLSWG